MRQLLPAILSLLVFSVAADGQNKLEWDLTYATLLETNKVEEGNWLRRWTTSYKTPAETWI